MSKNLLEVRKLNKVFASRFGPVQAVDNVSFKIERGEIMALIGQSGSGKTTVANSLMRMLHDVTGIVVFDDEVVSNKIRGKELRNFYRRVQKIFQDPHTALNERQNVYSILAEPLKVHKLDKEWIKDFKAHEKQIAKTFALTLEQKFLQVNLDLLKSRNELYLKVLDQITADLSEVNDSTISGSGNLADTFSSVVASYFDHLISFENGYLGFISSAIKDLLNFYYEAKERITKRDLPWDEVALIEAEQALSDYVDSYDDRKIIAKEKNLLNDARTKQEQFAHNTNQIILEVTADHKSRVKANRVKAALASTKSDQAFFKLKVKSHQRAANAWQHFKNKKLLVDRNVLFAFDDALMLCQNTQEVKRLVDEHKAIFAKLTKEKREIFSNAANEIIAVIALKKGKINQPDKKRVEELKQALERARAVFNIELEKAQSEMKSYRQRIASEHTKFEGQFTGLEVLSRRKQLDAIFNKWFKLIIGKSKLPSEKSRMQGVVKAKIDLIDAHRYEQKKELKTLRRVSVVYRLNKGIVFRRYSLIKNLLVEREVMNSLISVGLKPEHAFRYPHEFSGGQKQRINIARALILKPELIIADEPVASLDVSIQAQVINLLVDLVKKQNISMIFIGHDLSVIRYIATSICVMHLGKVVERGLSEPIFNMPVHPYTKTLFSAIPKMSNANEPFRAPQESLDYLQEYAQAMPKEKLVEEHHYVLANNDQFAKWVKNDRPVVVEQTPDILVQSPLTVGKLASELTAPANVNEKTKRVKAPKAKHQVAKLKATALSKDLYIEFRDGKWFVNTDGLRAHKSFTLQKDAIVYARSMARTNKSMVHVRNRDGKVRLSLAFDDKRWKGKIVLNSDDLASKSVRKKSTNQKSKIKINKRATNG